MFLKNNMHIEATFNGEKHLLTKENGTITFPIESIGVYELVLSQKMSPPRLPTSEKVSSIIYAPFYVLNKAYGEEKEWFRNIVPNYFVYRVRIEIKQNTEAIVSYSYPKYNLKTNTWSAPRISINVPKRKEEKYVDEIDKNSFDNAFMQFIITYITIFILISIIPMLMFISGTINSNKFLIIFSFFVLLLFLSIFSIYICYEHRRKKKMQFVYRIMAAGK